jgi:transcriptional regulator with XRE-family HTH domain/tetratricopeptide (TPR) repeat protein
MPTRKATETGVFVAFLRSLRAWSQEELAKAAGVDPRLISRYELGKKVPRESTLKRLTKAVGLPFSEAEQVFPVIRRALAAVSRGGGLPSAGVALDTAGLASIVAAVVQSATAELPLPVMAPSDSDSLSPAEARRQAGELWESMKGLTARDCRVLVDGAREYKNWAFAELLSHESERSAAKDAVMASELATLALRVAELASVEEARRPRLQGYAWFFVANARRVFGDLPGAEEACSQALRLWKVPSSADPGPLQEWRVLDLEASLRREQRRWDEALRLHDRARATAPPEEQSLILLNKSMTMEQSGAHELAIEILIQAAYGVDAHKNPRLAFAVHANLALNLSRLGRFTDAESFLPEARRLASELGTGLDLTRLRWVEGLTAAGLGRRGEAIEVLSQVREEFLSQAIAYDAALVSLELAVLYLEDGRVEAVKALARQTVPLFQAQGVHREAMAAIRLFQDAVEKEEATAEMARRLLDRLKEGAREVPSP